jgi:hypothetical protein
MSRESLDRGVTIMKNISKLGALGLSLIATAGAMQPLHAANSATSAAKGSAQAKQVAEQGDPEFCARSQPADSRIVRQACKTMSGWELIGVELLFRK